MNDLLPTVAAELERKTVEQFERIVRAKEQGKITQAQFASSIETIFMVVSGLVPEPIILALECQDISKSDGTFDTKRVFWKRQSGESVSVHRHSQGERLTITKFKVGEIQKPTTFEYTDAVIPAQKAALAQERLANGLIDAGYLEV